MNEQVRDKKYILKWLEETDTKLPTCMAVFLTFLFYYGLYKTEQIQSFDNIKIYLLSIFIFFIVFFAVLFMMSRVANTNSFYLNSNEHLPALIFLVFGLLFLVLCYYGELDCYSFPKDYFRHQIPGIMYIVILSIMTGVVLSRLQTQAIKNTLWRKFFRLLISFVQGGLLYCVNPFYDDTYHINAYTVSILNTLAGTPFEMYSNSIYGHYGVLYFIPVRIFHGMGMDYWTAIAFTMSILGGVSFLLMYWCIDQLIRNDTVYLLSVSAIAVVSFQVHVTQVYQLIPHRFLFQALVMTGCLIAFRKSGSRSVKIIMWVVSALSILWNTETGLVFGIVWMLVSVYLDAKQKGSYSFVSVVKNVIFLVLEFLVGYVFVIVYNLIAGGDAISPGTYIYPIGAKIFLIGDMQIQLMNPLNGYFMVIALFLGTIGLNFSKVLLKRLTEAEYLLIVSSIMGIGVFTYYMNRAVSTNASIVIFPLVLLLGYIVDRNFCVEMKAKDNVDEDIISDGGFRGMIKTLTIKRATGIICVIILTGLSLASVSALGNTVASKIATSWDRRDIQSIREYLKETIPEDAVAFGAGTPLLFAILDRQSGIYLSEWEDVVSSTFVDEMDSSLTGVLVNPDAREYLINTLKEEQYEHLVLNDVMSIYLPEGQYRYVEGFQIDEYSFAIYERIHE